MINKIMDTKRIVTITDCIDIAVQDRGFPLDSVKFIDYDIQ